MIGIDIIRKKRSTVENSGSSKGAAGVSVSSGGDAQNAVHADNADHANRADEATHAASAKELDGGSSVWNTIRTWISNAKEGLGDLFLRKDQADETKFKLTMGEAEVKGALTVGGEATSNQLKSKDFNSNNPRFGTGFGMLMQGNASHAYLDYLYVRTKMFVEELEVRILSRVAGDYVFSKAGSRIVYVEPYNTSKEAITDKSTDKTVAFYRCYYLQDNGTTQTVNNWAVGDFARCKKSNIKEVVTYNATNKYYTRMVISVSSEPVAVSALDANKKYGYIDLTNTDSYTINYPYKNDSGEDAKAELNCSDCMDGTDAPEADDDIVQIGNALANETTYTKGAFKERSNVIIISATEGGILIYTGIDTPADSSMANYLTDSILPSEVRFRTDHFSVVPYAAPKEATTITCYRGEYAYSKNYGHNDLVTYKGQVWICTVKLGEKIKGIAPSLTTEDGRANWDVYTAKGADGKGIASIDERYYATANESLTPTVDGYGWVDSIDKSGWRSDCPYLWAYSITELSDGSKTNGTPYLKAVWGQKGDKGDAPTVAKLRVNYSACHFSRTSNTWDHDSVTVTIVIMDGSKITIAAYGDTSRYYWRLSTDDKDTMRASGWGFNPSLNASSYTLSLYKTGGDANLPLDTITVPFIVDGKDGDGDPGVSYMFSVIKKELRINLPSGSGEMSDNGFTLSWNINMNLCKLTGSSEVAAVGPDSFKAYWLFADGTNMETNGLLTQSGSTISGNGTQEGYNITSSSRVVGLRIDAIIGGNVVAQQQIDASIETGSWLNKTNEAISMGVTNGESIGKISAKADGISLKVQDLQSGGIDTSKPHTSSQVDFTSLSANNFYPVLIRFKDDGGVRHAVEISRPLDGKYGTGESYMTHGNGFSFRLLFSDVANDWGSREGGQLRIESISQYLTSPSDTPICPKIAQYYNFSIMVAWLRGGSKYDITVDCVDTYISGIWPYMMQVESNPSWVPDVVRFAPDTWTTAQINAQGDNAYNLLKHDDGGFYADTDNEYLYRFGNLTAGHTFAIVGQPKDSKQWFMATWHIASLSGSKVYVDISSYGILWQTQNPLGIRMNGVLGYIKKGVSYSKSAWDSESGFGTSESIDNTAVHANWVTSRPILIIGKESSSTDGVYRDRAVLESVETCSEGSSVSFYSGSYFDVSPLYGTDGRANVKADLLATGIDIKSHKILATTDNFEVRNNSGTTTFTIDKDGNIVGGNNAMFKGSVTSSAFSLTSDKFVVNSDGTFKLDMTNFEVDEDGNITAKGGAISFFKFDQEGLYTPYTEGDNGAKWNGIGMSINNISVSGNSNNRISSVYLGNGRIDSRWSNSNNRTTYRAGSTSLGSTFYNYIKLEKINSSYNSFENDPVHAAFGVETQGDVCITALGGPSYFQALAFATESVFSDTKADGKRTLYFCSGGSTFTMPKDPTNGLLIIVIQTSGGIIYFDGNGKRFRNGSNISDPDVKAYSNVNGQWSFFIYDYDCWHCNFIEPGSGMW